MRAWLTGLAVAGVLVSGAAQATLVDRGGGLIYDTELNITWLQDANFAKTSGYSTTGQMNWNDAMTWAENLVYHDSVRNVDYSDWRLPSALNQDGSGPCWLNNCASSEMGHLFYMDGDVIAGDQITSSGLLNSLFFYMQSDIYWSGTEYAYNPANVAWIFSTFAGGQINLSKSATVYAWAVSDGDIAGASVAPEPATLALTFAGLGLAGLARRRRRVGAS